MKAQLLSIDLLVAGALLLGAYAMLSHAAEFSFSGGEEYAGKATCFYEHCSNGTDYTDCGALDCSRVSVQETVVSYADTGMIKTTCLRSERACK